MLDWIAVATQTEGSSAIQSTRRSKRAHAWIGTADLAAP